MTAQEIADAIGPFERPWWPQGVRYYNVSGCEFYDSADTIDTLPTDTVELLFIAAAVKWLSVEKCLRVLIDGAVVRTLDQDKPGRIFRSLYLLKSLMAACDDVNGTTPRRHPDDEP